MTEATPKSFLPERFRILSGSSLKLIAIITMLIDHTAFVLLTRYPAAMEPLFLYRDQRVFPLPHLPGYWAGGFPNLLFSFGGRLSAYQKQKKIRLQSSGFACISEIPWNFMFQNTWHYKKQNVFFTLLLGYLAFCAIEQFRENERLQFLSVLLLLGISLCLNADYGWKGYIFLLIMYLLRNYKASQAIVGSCWLHYEWKACFAFLSINMYNGQRGFIKGKAAKYFFYIFIRFTSQSLLF